MAPFPSSLFSLRRLSQLAAPHWLCLPVAAKGKRERERVCVCV
uniref:Uncharacterized protein n=1 Tax=Arundo donax TaxID=35708 RepID=A0A0A9BC73_ARUDO